MVLSRVLENRIASLYRAGKIVGGVYLGIGQEALSASVGTLLGKGDVFAPLIRDMAGRLAFGESPLDALRTYLGSRKGPMRGRDGNIHRGRPASGMPAMISHLGGMIAVVNGMLFARRLRGWNDSVGATCIGDGGTSTGAFHEALNQAAIEKLPLVMVVANNRYAYSTSNDRQFACQDLLSRAEGYGIAGHAAQGNSLLSCFETMKHAVAAAREGGGPQLVVANLLRLCGHGEHDDASYVADDDKTSVLNRDCLEVAREEMLAEGRTEADLKAVQSAAREVVDQATAQAQQEPEPDPYADDWRATKSEFQAHPSS